MRPISKRLLLCAYLSLNSIEKMITQQIANAISFSTKLIRIDGNQCSFFFRFLPKQSSLTIYNFSQLFINLEGCVNTLSDECKDFLHSHGRDGTNNTAQSRYPCFYNKV